MVVRNDDVTPATQQYASIGAEYSGSNYVQISQEAFTPDATTTDIPTSVGTVTPASPSIIVNQYGAAWAEITVPVAAALGSVQVEAHIAGTADEDALSIGGAWVELGSDFLEPRAFNGDDFRTNQILSRSGKARQLTNFEFEFSQTGDSSAASTDSGRSAVIKIPVFATASATVGGTGMLVVFVRVKDRLTGSYVNTGSVSKVSVVVTSGTEPTASGSVTLTDQTSQVSTNSTVPVRSVVAYDVVATVSSGSAFITSETLTLDTSATTGLRACNVEVISQGTNIIYIQSTSVAFSRFRRVANGESSAVLTIQGLQAADLTSDPKGNEVKFRLAMRADESGAGAYTMGSNTFNLESITASGEPAGTQPTVTVSSASGSTVYIGSQFGIDLTVEYPANDLASTGENDFEVEFVNDLRTSYEIRMCSVHVVSIGRDLPCARGRLTGDLAVTYSLSNSSQVNQENKDVATTSLPLTCATSRSQQDAADRTIRVRAVGQFVAGQTLAETTFNPGAGMVFDENTLYAGLVGDMTLATALTSYTGGTGNPVIKVLDPGTLTFGKVHMVSVVLYVPPGGHSPTLSITATSTDPASFRIDRIYLSRIGRNFGCLNANNKLVNLDQLRQTNPDAEPETYPAFSVDSDEVLGSSVTITLGAVSNVGSTSDPGILNTVETDDVMVRDNHIVLAVAVQAMTGDDGAAPADASFDLKVAGMKDASAAITEVTASISFSAGATHYSAASDPALSTTFTPRDDDTIYQEIPKVVELTATLPEGYYGTLKVQCAHGASDTSQWEVKGAAPLRHGQNVHGVWVPEAKAELTTGTLGGLELTTQADLVLRDVTRLETLPTPADEDNLLKVACVALVPATTDASGSITVQVTLMDNNDATIGSPLETTLTLSTGEYTPPASSSEFSVNQTIDLSSNTEVPSASIGQYFWVPFKLVIPPGVHKSELALVTATEGERAIYTVHSIRYGANMGLDVMGAPLLTEDLLNHTHTNRDLTHLSQFDSLLVNLGSITNLGLSGEMFRGKGTDDQWGMEMEVEVRATDHPLLHSSATATKPLYISFKLGDIIVVESQDVTATVAGSEKVKLEAELTLKKPEKTQYDKEVDQKVGLTVTVKHNNMSTQEAMDGRVVIIFPPYMNYTEGEVEANSSSITVLYKGSSVALVVGDIYFSDIFTIDFNASIDPDYVRGRGSGWANATTLARPICRPTLVTNAYARCGPMTYTMYEVNTPECSEPLLGSLADCRFAVSAAIERGGSYGPAAIKGSTGWRPPVRGESSWTNQYVEIRFGVPTRVSGWSVTNEGARKVTEVKLMASEDGLFFQEKHTGTVTDNMAKEDLGEKSFRTKYVRIVISAADADASQYIQIRAELYGCHTDTAPESTCPTVDDNTIYSNEPRKWRHFAVDTTNNVIYYCDYDMAKDAMLCFASRDDEVWIGQPKYIGQLRGHSGGKMYAYDSKMSSTLASTDGEHWQVVEEADVPASFDAVSVVKGTTSSETTAVRQGDYEGDYYGIKKSGSYLLKWSKCCSN